MRKAARVLVPCLALLATLAPARAEDGVTPFLFVSESHVDRAASGIWSLAVQDVAEAQSRSERGNEWAAYEALTGGPAARYRFYIRLDKLAELDGWTSIRKVVVEEMGADAGAAALRVLDTADTLPDRLAAYSEELSRPPAPREAPYPYYWVLSVRIDDGKLIEYASLIKRIKRAHDAQQPGAHWTAYADAIGGEPGRVELYFPFDRFAELDGWPGTTEALAARYGPDEAARIVEALDAISATTVELWSLVPALSVPSEGQR